METTIVYWGDIGFRVQGLRVQGLELRGSV